MFIPGFLITILTFPGVIVHELAHLLLCRLAGVRVYEYCLFQLESPAGYVVHQKPESLFKHFLITFGPFFVNSSAAIAIFAFLFILNSFAFSGGMVSIFFMWLGLSIGMHSFPSTGDGKALFEASHQAIKKGNLLAIIYWPFSALTYVGALASIFWADLIYAFILFVAVTGFMSSVSYGLGLMDGSGLQDYGLGTDVSGTSYAQDFPQQGTIENEVVSFDYALPSGIINAGAAEDKFKTGIFEYADILLAGMGLDGVVVIGVDNSEEIIQLDVSSMGLVFGWGEFDEILESGVQEINGQQWYIERIESGEVFPYMTRAIAKCENGVIIATFAGNDTASAAFFEGILGQATCRQTYYNVGVSYAGWNNTVISGEEAELTISMMNSNPAEVKIFFDGELKETLEVNESNLDSYDEITETFTFEEAGEHSLKVTATSTEKDFDSDSSDNEFTDSFAVVSGEADLAITEITAIPLNEKFKAFVGVKNVSIKDANFVLEIYAGGELIKSVDAFLENRTGEIYYTDLIEEANEIEAKILLGGKEFRSEKKAVGSCGTENVFLLEKTSAGFGEEAKSFIGTLGMASLLEKNNYCFLDWSQADFGFPETDLVQEFDLLTVNNATYLEASFSTNDILLVKAFDGPVLLEGGDVAYGSRYDEEFSIDYLGLESVDDISPVEDNCLLTVQEYPDLPANHHPIAMGINSWALNSGFSGYSDQFEAIEKEGNYKILNWDCSNTAMLAMESPKRIVLIGFALKALDSENSREQLLMNSIHWLQNDAEYFREDYK